MSIFQRIDLSQLPPPAVVEELSYEQILTAAKTDLITKDPALAPVLALESEPLTKLLQVFAYRELLMRQRVNEAARKVMLAFATGSDLDHLGANYGVPRLLLDEGDALAIPPVAPTYEPDGDYRRRIQLAPEAYTTAGSEASYLFHGLSADGQVADVSAQSPQPGVVAVHVLARAGDGVPDAGLLATVEAALSAETVRPLTDLVSVNPAEIVPFSVDATLYLFDGPSEDVVLAAVNQALAAYLTASRALGRDITLSGLYHALHQEGVQRVALTSPAADVVIAPHQAGHCTATGILVGGRDD